MLSGKSIPLITNLITLIECKRDYSKLDVNLFTSRIQELSAEWEQPERWNAKIIDDQASLCTEIVTKALDEQIPLKPVKIRPKWLNWWTSTLEGAKRKLCKVYRLVKGHSPSQFIIHSYQSLLREFKQMVRKAKRESWKKFTESTESTSELARLAKIIRYHPKHTIGLLRRENGTMTSTPEQTLELLTNSTFPGSVQVNPDSGTTYTLAQMRKFTPKEAEHWLSTDMVREAFSDFGPLKAAGPDGIKPILLKHLPHNFITKLQTIYSSTIQSGYTPAIWRKSKVIYIPKTGKETYVKPKSFRPITLTSYLFKGLEKLVYWHLQNTTLRTKPYHTNQHAFRTGKSTESALSSILNKIEKGTTKGGYSMAIFLDCAGAFDNLSFAAAARALKIKKVNKTIATWYNNYLQNRVSSVELNGITREISIKSGCPQGGILSVLLWNICFDQLLSKFTTGRVRCIGFADDGTLIIHGKDLKNMRNQM